MGYADSQVQAWRRRSSPTVAAVEKSVEIPHVLLDKVVDMPVIVNDRVLHSRGASIQFIACFRGHFSCATQTGTMLPAFFLMVAMMGFLDACCVIFRAPPAMPELSASFSSFRALTAVSARGLQGVPESAGV